MKSLEANLSKTHCARKRPLTETILDWKIRFSIVTSKINGGDNSAAVMQEYLRLLDTEPDDPDAYLNQIVDS